MSPIVVGLRQHWWRSGKLEKSDMAKLSCQRNIVRFTWRESSSGDYVSGHFDMIVNPDSFPCLQKTPRSEHTARHYLSFSENRRSAYTLIATLTDGRSSRDAWPFHTSTISAQNEANAEDAKELLAPWTPNPVYMHWLQVLRELFWAKPPAGCLPSKQKEWYKG